MHFPALPGLRPARAELWPSHAHPRPPALGQCEQGPVSCGQGLDTRPRGPGSGAGPELSQTLSAWVLKGWRLAGSGGRDLQALLPGQQAEPSPRRSHSAS